MLRYMRFCGPLALAVILTGCQLPVSQSEEVGTSGAALVAAFDQDCARAMLERYAECRRLDCAPDAMVPRPFDRLCERNCRAEAELAYDECAADAAEVVTLDEVETLEVPVWSQPDYRIEEHARRIVPDCPECESF